MDKTFFEIIKKHNSPLSLIPSGMEPDLKKLDGIKIILFDIYGTLFASENELHTFEKAPAPDLSAKLDEFISSYGLDVKPVDLVKMFKEKIRATNNRSKSFNDHPEVDILKIWNAITGISDLHTLRKIALEFELIINKAYPLCDLGLLMERLKEKGVIPGIISNAQFYTELLLEFFLEKTLEESGFDPDLMLFSYKFRTAKPSMKLFDKITSRIEKKGFKKNEVLFAGNDYTNDILPSYKTGFKTLLFAGDSRSLNENKTGIEPDVILTDWDQITEIL